MNENPYEAPAEPQVGSDKSQGSSVIMLWRVGRFIFLLGVILSAACFLPVLILDPRSKASSVSFLALTSAGLTMGVAGTMVGGFLLILSHVLAKPAPSTRPQIGHWFGVATLWICIAAVGLVLFVPAMYAVGSSRSPELVFQREMTFSVMNATCVVAGVMLLINVVGRWQR